jgi:hypothetical protein
MTAERLDVCKQEAKRQYDRAEAAEAERDALRRQLAAEKWVLRRAILKQTVLEDALKRAAYVAEHLMQMIDRETWLASGGDDGQGHYEGDYREAQIALEIREWATLADPNRDTRP